MKTMQIFKKWTKTWGCRN